jgi:hypothetical protein
LFELTFYILRPCRCLRKYSTSIRGPFPIFYYLHHIRHFSKLRSAPAAIAGVTITATIAASLSISKMQRLALNYHNCIFSSLVSFVMLINYRLIA